MESVCVKVPPSTYTKTRDSSAVCVTFGVFAAVLVKVTVGVHVAVIVIVLVAVADTISVAVSVSVIVIVGVTVDVDVADIISVTVLVMAFTVVCVVVGDCCSFDTSGDVGEDFLLQDTNRTDTNTAAAKKIKTLFI